MEEAKKAKNKKIKSKKLIVWKKIIIVFLVLLIVIGAYWVSKKIFKNEPKQIYQAAIMVRDQENSDPAEDRRTSLKSGDVLMVADENHKWSNTEKISYLILKMNLTESQKNKLTQPEEREKEKNELTEEEKKIMEENENFETSKELIRIRQYRIKIEDFDFEPLDLLKGQPFLEEIYDWKIVEKKKNK
jgi:hypothetical protein